MTAESKVRMTDIITLSNGYGVNSYGSYDRH
jgi:hypothetical protein